MSNCGKNEQAKLQQLELEMAHVVGVPRRDPCQKCQLPVFLAERLTVGKKVFHRTCLKCARCGSQLAIGSFYETEVDDVFCCETCPDEEELEDTNDVESSGSSKVELRGNAANGNQTPLRTVRSSIADRLAFFEQSKTNGTANQQQQAVSHNVLQKSVSDEEKSKDLQATAAATTSSYKMNSALSNFLNDTIDGGEEEDSSEISSSAQLNVDNAMDTSDTEEESESLGNKQVASQPPELPRSQPPIEPQPESKRFTATAQLQLITSNTIEDEPKQAIIKTPVEDMPSVDAVKGNDDKNTDGDVKQSAVTAAETSEAHKSANELDLSATYNVNIESVTKDTNADALETPIVEKAIEEVVELRDQTASSSSQNEDKATTERLSVVRTRLQQFEEITNNKTNNSNINENENDNNEMKLNLKLSPEEDNLKLNNTNDDKIKLNEIDQDKNHDDDNVKEMAPATAIEIENTELEEPKSMPQESHNEEKTETNDGTNTMESNSTFVTTATPKPSPRKVPSRMEIQNENDDKGLTEEKDLEKEKSPSEATITSTPTKPKTKLDDYPEDLNPFASDDDDEDDTSVLRTKDSNKENAQNNNNNKSNSNNVNKLHHSISKSSQKLDNSNPFDSSDDEIELEKMNSTPVLRTQAGGKMRPPRPPPPRISRNPFEGESDDNEADSFSRNSSLSSSSKRKTPVPTPRSNLDHYGSFNSLAATTPLQRNSDIRGSNNSLTSSASGTVRSRKNRKAPAPPQPPTVKELFPSTETLGSSIASTPSSSTMGSPKVSRKKRPAPAPPKPARNLFPQITHDQESKNLHSYPLQSPTSSKLSDEEKALLEGKTDAQTPVVLRIKPPQSSPADKLAAVTRRNSRRLIPLDPTILKDAAENAHENPQCDDQKQQQLSGKLAEVEDHNVVYRRVIMPPSLHTPTRESNPLIDSLNTQDRQSEKLKDNKEAKNRNRQSQQSGSSGAEDNDAAIYNKSAHGKWKRRKGPAPALPIPPRKVLQMLPLQEIRHELEIIEVQQQGLEKQGVVLEKMIRDRCEGQAGEQLNAVAAGALTGAGDQAFKTGGVQNSKEVEDLILQLFELVNEKNELFRRQAELMYLRRQHRLEQEQADLEYEIRVLMAQPERNKTDTDKAREEALIARLVDVVQLRNEVVECLEMDRLREAEEDLSIKQRLEQHNAKRDGHNSDDSIKKFSTKLSKKEKKKQKEAKKLIKNKKIDADKDADETELKADKQKLKKKRKFLF